MVSKNTIKRITSLNQKKYRNREGQFVAEGTKVIGELLDSNLTLLELFAENLNDYEFIDPSKLKLATASELKKLSHLITPQKAIAVFEIPKSQTLQKSGLTVLLDNVRDPGNLGTIIRLCDWFGLEQLVCSDGTVDCYNPKVVQATMGSLTRVAIHYTSLPTYLENDTRPIFGTFMEGENIYKSSLPASGIIIMGNEANGISKEIEHLITTRLSIPRFGTTQATESLNVATATAICLSEFRRRF